VNGESNVFRCQICQQVARAGAKAQRVVLVSREKTYAQRGGHEGFQRRFRAPRPPKQEFDKGGRGHEIVREVLACDACAARVKPIVEAAAVEEHDDTELIAETAGSDVAETAEATTTETATTES